MGTGPTLSSWTRFKGQPPKESRAFPHVPSHLAAYAAARSMSQGTRMGKELRGFATTVLVAVLVFVALVLTANEAGAMTDAHGGSSPVLVHPTPDPDPG